MKALRLLLPPLALALLSCGGGNDDTSCRLNTPALQYRLHHDADATGGQTSPSVNSDTFLLAVRFDAALLQPVSCGELGAVRFHWWSQVPQALAVKVFGAGTATEPGALLYEQAVTTLLYDDWNVVTLASPVDLVGGDRWIALEVTSASRGAASIGMDVGPKVAGVNFVYVDGTWQEYGNPYNFGIQALVWH